MNAQPKPRQERQLLEERIRERVRALRTARLIEYLDLDEATTRRLMPIVNRVYDEIGAVARDTGQSRRELRDLVRQTSPDASRMTQLADRIVANRQRMAKSRGEASGRRGPSSRSNRVPSTSSCWPRSTAGSSGRSQGPPGEPRRKIACPF